MKVWIIYDSKFGHCKKLAETLEDLLEGDCDLSVGFAKKISPNDVLEESPEAVLVGGPIHFGKPSRVISSWVKGCYKLTRSLGLRVGKTGAFTTRDSTSGVEIQWQQLFLKYPFAAKIFPQVLAVKLVSKSGALTLELNSHVYEIIEDLRHFLLQKSII